jgi:hypothetical protein
MNNKTIHDHINNDMNEIDNPNTSGQRRRHLETELDSLRKYKDNHPNDDHDPTPLEMFCDENPDAPECRIHDI